MIAAVIQECSPDHEILPKEALPDRHTNFLEGPTLSEADPLHNGET